MKPPPAGEPRPEPPVAPELEDCCRSGCTPCVFDLYQDAMERYRIALAAWEQRRQRRPAKPSAQRKPR